MAKGRGLDQQQHGLYADEHWKLRLRFEIAMLSGGGMHPYNMIVHQKGEDDIVGYLSTEVHHLEMHQAVSFLLRQELA